MRPPNEYEWYEGRGAVWRRHVGNSLALFRRTVISRQYKHWHNRRVG